MGRSRKGQHLTMQRKLEILHFCEQHPHMSRRQVARDWLVHEKTVRNIIKQREDILKTAKVKCQNVRIIKGSLLRAYDSKQGNYSEATP